MHKIKLAMLGATLALQPAAAHAQAWIGTVVGNIVAQGQAAQQELACMNGAPMPDREVFEARTPAVAVMQAYFASARSNGPLLPHFQTGKPGLWTSGDIQAAGAQIDRQRDPLANAGLTLDREPIGFVRAGDGASALGQWLARDANGAAAGTYTAHFTRRKGSWRLSALALGGRRDYADPVVQYCHKAGDVMPFRIANTRFNREQLEKQLAKIERKLAEAGSTRPSPEQAERIARLEGQRRDTREMLADAREAEKYIAAEAKAAEDAKAAAIAALAAA